MPSPSADPANTRQWAGHLKHKEHLKAQEDERRLRKGLNPKRKKK